MLRRLPTWILESVIIESEINTKIGYHEPCSTDSNHIKIIDGSHFSIMKDGTLLNREDPTLRHALCALYKEEALIKEVEHSDQTFSEVGNMKGDDITMPVDPSPITDSDKLQMTHDEHYLTGDIVETPVPPTHSLDTYQESSDHQGNDNLPLPNAGDSDDEVAVPEASEEKGAISPSADGLLVADGEISTELELENEQMPNESNDSEDIDSDDPFGDDGLNHLNFLDPEIKTMPDVQSDVENKSDDEEYEDMDLGNKEPTSSREIGTNTGLEDSEFKEEDMGVNPKDIDHYSSAEYKNVGEIDGVELFTTESESEEDDYGSRTVSAQALNTMIQDEDDALGTGDDYEFPGYIEDNEVYEPMVIHYTARFGEGPPKEKRDDQRKSKKAMKTVENNSPYTPSIFNSRSPTKREHLLRKDDRNTKSQGIDGRPTAKVKMESVQNLNPPPDKGKKKIFHSLPKWKKEAKVCSFKNWDHEPAPSKVKIFNEPRKWTAESKLGSLKNTQYIPQGGNVTLPRNEINWKAESKIGSLDNNKRMRQMDKTADSIKKMESIDEEDEFIDSRGNTKNDNSIDGKRLHFTKNKHVRPKNHVRSGGGFHGNLSWKKLSSLKNIGYKPQCGNGVIKEEDPHWEDTAKIESHNNNNHKPAKSQVKIPSVKLNWSKKSKVQSLRSMFEKAEKDNVTAENYDETWAAPPERHNVTSNDANDLKKMGSQSADQEKVKSVKGRHDYEDNIAFNPVDQWFKDYKQNRKSRREMLQGFDQDDMEQNGGNGILGNRKYRKIKPITREEDPKSAPSEVTENSRCGARSMPDLEDQGHGSPELLRRVLQTGSGASTVAQKRIDTPFCGVDNQLNLGVSGSKTSYSVRPGPTDRLSNRGMDPMSFPLHAMRSKHRTKMAPVENPEHQEKNLWSEGQKNVNGRIRSICNTDNIPIIHDSLKIKHDKLKRNPQAAKVEFQDKVYHAPGGGQSSLFNQKLALSPEVKVDCGALPSVIREGTYNIIKNKQE